MNLLAAGIVAIGIGYWMFSSGPSLQPYTGPLRLVPGTSATPIAITHTFPDGANMLYLTNAPGTWDNSTYTRIYSTDGTGWDYIGAPSDFNIQSYRSGVYHQNTQGFYSLI